MNPQEQQYLDLLTKLLDAPFKGDRTGTGTHSIFGHQMRFDLTQGFPLLTTKKVHFKSVIAELLWFLSGSTNNNDLRAMGCTIWDEWSKEDGSLGAIYGKQWRNFGGGIIETDHYDGETKRYLEQDIPGFDQISWVINEIKTNPDSRRLIVSAWNPQDHCVDGKAALPPCHTLFQFFVEPMTLNERKRWVDKNYVGGGKQAITDHAKTYPNMYPIASSDEDYREHHINVCDFVKAPKAKLSCQLYQRSCDTFLGLPFNIASYALLTHLIAQECGLDVGEFVWTGGDVHLYSNHVDQAKEQFTRTPYPFPKLGLDLKGKSIFDLEPGDISIVDYVSHPAIKAEVAV